MFQKHSFKISVDCSETLTCHLWHKTDGVICRICAMCPSHRKQWMGCKLWSQWCHCRTKTKTGFWIPELNSNSPDWDKVTVFKKTELYSVEHWLWLKHMDVCLGRVAFYVWFDRILLLMTEMSFLHSGVISAGKRWLSTFCTWSTYCTFKLRTSQEDTEEDMSKNTHHLADEPLLFWTAALFSKVVFVFLIMHMDWVFN